VTAESVRGTSHFKSGAGCQDSHFVATVDPAILIGAVADGAGSAPQSEIGAEIAARIAVQELQRWSTFSQPWPETEQEWSPIITRALDCARIAVENEAAAMGVAPRDLASTLIVMLATPQLVVAGQIGDGAVVLADAADKFVALTAPQSGEYLNETTFLVSPRAIEQAQTSVWRGEARFLAAFSDGLQMLALRMSDGTAHKPFFAPLFRFLEEQTDLSEAGTQLRSFLTSPRITQRADDDLTLLLAQCVR
jgi:serine/threonine protein phosphatase PrpC